MTEIYKKTLFEIPTYSRLLKYRPLVLSTNCTKKAVLSPKILRPLTATNPESVLQFVSKIMSP